MEQIRERRRISVVKEGEMLLRQSFSLLVADKRKLTIMFAFPMVAALITVWIAGKNMFVHYDGTKSASFVLVSAAIWGGLFNSIQMIVKERANVKRDYLSGMRIGLYMAAKGLTQLLLCAFQSAVLLLAIGGISLVYGNELPQNGVVIHNLLLEYYVSFFLIMYCADTMGLCISAYVKKPETASVLAPYILIVQLIFSGILFSMKGAADIVSYFMISRWGMEALGSTARLNEIPLSYSGMPHEAERMYEATAGHLGVIWLVLLMAAIGFLIAGTLLLRNVAKDKR